ncbi:PREDICTED: transcription factor BIM3 isoform X1 [Tarenaya hassleriana]|uniref:transcription factor BIM3 isoform X1 n=1 Tax=Tarenaya hassleriana TaxID=28532 RepID=UPI00053C85D9|nr:PREDICTED: transcription factor BIM3 isoform X1 [Tarenaya hassleriana]
MKSPDLEEQEDNDVYDNLPCRNGSSSGEVTRRKTSTYRSKHSETEQRRRSKINERFQTLMDLIPQNDQKRDKASFLLEVIEYIHFLQEKLQMYEGSHQMWNQGSAKLIPWRNNPRPAEDASDHSQGMKSWSSHEKAFVAPEILSDMQNSLDADVDSIAVFRTLNQDPTSELPSYFPAHPTLQFVQQDSCQVRPSSGSAVCNTSEPSNLKEKNLASSSTAYSQGVLSSLTEALKSSGVNLSETLISVQLSVGKRADPEAAVTASASAENTNGLADREVGSQGETRSFYEESKHAQKRIRR